MFMFIHSVSHAYMYTFDLRVSARAGMRIRIMVRPGLWVRVDGKGYGQGPTERANRQGRG